MKKLSMFLFTAILLVAFSAPAVLAEANSGKPTHEEHIHSWESINLNTYYSGFCDGCKGYVSKYGGYIDVFHAYTWTIEEFECNLCNAYNRVQTKKSDCGTKNISPEFEKYLQLQKEKEATKSSVPCYPCPHYWNLANEEVVTTVFDCGGCVIADDNGSHVEYHPYENAMEYWECTSCGKTENHKHTLIQDINCEKYQDIMKIK